MTRSKALLIAAPFALVLGLLLLLPLLIDKAKVLELAAATLREQTGATLTVAGESSLSLFPTPGVTLGDAGLVLPAEEQPSLRARSVGIRVRLLPLLSGRVEIDSLALDGLAVTIRSTAPGAGDAPASASSDLSDTELDAFYARRREATAQAGADAGATAIALPLALNIKRLTVTDSIIERVDSATQASTVIELARLEATGLNLEGNPVALAVQATLAGERPLAITLDGSVRVERQNLAVVLDNVRLVATGATPAPIELQTRGTVDLARQVADLTLSLASGEVRGEGSLRYARFESPQIDTKLKLNLLNPALLALAGPAAAGRSGADTAADGRDQPLPLDAIRAIDTRAELAVEQAQFDTLTVNDLQATLRIVDGVIQLSAMTGVLYGGKLALQATFNGSHSIATLDTSGRLEQADIAAALAAGGAQPVLGGNASIDWTLASEGRTRNELVAAVSGPIRLTSNQVVLNDISIEQLLCQAVALTNQEQLTASFPASTTFTTLDADIRVADGRAQLDPLRADLPQVALTGRGNFDLVSKDFKATFKARLSPQLETLDRACRVSKRLTAIDWPVDCKGNASGEPAEWCRVDTQEIVEDLGENEVRRKLEKKAGKLLDKLFNR